MESARPGSMRALAPADSFAPIRSAYWTPQLCVPSFFPSFATCDSSRLIQYGWCSYFQWANGSFSSVQWVGAGLLIYYLQRNNPADTTKVTAFPDGFRMLTGDPFRRSYEDSLTSKAIGWNW